MKIKILVDGREAIAELNNSETAKRIYDALPLEARFNLWGDEIYFSIPVHVDLEEGASNVVEKGDLAFWPEGDAFCIFFGRTPTSTDTEIRAASAVNVFGKIKNGLDVFKGLKTRKMRGGESLKQDGLLPLENYLKQ